MDKMNEKVLIFDSSAILYRSFYALPELTNPAGEKIQAIYGFFRLLLKMLKDFEPKGLIFVFDAPGQTFRHKELKEYKAQRKKMPSELQTQLQKVKELLKSAGFLTIEKTGLEADDLIASIVVNKKLENLEKIIITKDRDLFQLIGPTTKIYFLEGKKDKEKIFDQEKIQKEYQLSPSLLADFKSLVGDPSDNIPGVEGLGVKSAIHLLKKTGPLDEFFEKNESWKLEEKERVKILKNKDLILKNLHLIKLKNKEDVDFETEEIFVKIKHKEELKKIFEKMNFKSLLKDLEKINFNEK